MVNVNDSSTEIRFMANLNPTNNLDSWVTQFCALPADAQSVLSFLAIYSAPLQLARLRELCGALDVKPDHDRGGRNYYYPGTLKKHAWGQPRLKTSLDQLQKAGFVELPHGHALCKSVLRERIVHHLVKSGQFKKYSDVVLSLTGGQYYSSNYSLHTYRNPKSVEDHLREIRYNLIVGDAAGTKKFFFDFLDDLDNLVFTRTVSALFEAPDNWIQETDPTTRSMFLQFKLVQAISSLKPLSSEHWTMLLETAGQAKCDPKTQILLLDYALCAGKLDEIRPIELHGNMPGVLYQAHKAFLSGEYEKATDSYKRAKNYLPGLRNKRTTPLHYLSGIFSALCDLHFNKTGQVQAMAHAVRNQKSKVRDATFFPLNLDEAWTVLQSVAVKLEGLTPERLDPKKLGAATNRTKWLPLLQLGHETAWFSYGGKTELAETLLSLATKKETTFPWIAAEASELAASLGIGKRKAEPTLKSAESYRKSSDSVSLAGIITPKPDWEIWLDSLRSLTETEATSTSSATGGKDKGSRLAWRASFARDDVSFEPYEQVWSAKNQTWSQGRPIALNRLYASMHTLDFLTEQDRRAASHIKSYQYGSYYKKTEYFLDDEATRELVGHPLIFQAKDPTVRVELIEARPEITVEKSDKGSTGSIHVSFFPPLKIHKKPGFGEDDSGSDLFVFEETKTRYKVVSLSKKEQKIRKILGVGGKIFPLEAEASLTALLGNVLGDMTVKSDAKIEFESVPEVSAETKLYLHLAPVGEGLQAEFFVRPLGAEGPSHRPGNGSERVIGEAGGRNLQAARNLAAEAKKRDEIIARYPAFENAAATSKDQYIFETANDALAFLSELEDYKNGNTDENKTGKTKKQSIQSDDLEIYWPQTKHTQNRLMKTRGC